MFRFDFFKKKQEDNQNQSYLPNLCNDIINTTISEGHLSLKDIGHLSSTCKKLNNTIADRQVKFDNCQKEILYSEASKISGQISITYDKTKLYSEKFKFLGYDIEQFGLLKSAGNLLGYYTGYVVPDCPKFLQNYLLFMTFSLTNSHIDTISTVLKECFSHNSKIKMYSNDNPEDLKTFLIAIRTALLNANKKLNPTDKLVEYIAYIQTQSKVFAIDLFDLCLQLCDKNIDAKNLIKNQSNKFTL